MYYIVATLAGVSLSVMIFFLFYKKLNEEISVLKKEIEEKNERITELSSELSGKNERIKHLEERLTEEKKLLKTEFENLTNKILKQSKEELSATNKEKIEAILTPLKEKIASFQSVIESKHQDKIKEITSLKTEIKTLMELSNKVREDANNLAKALKGEVKTQGNWGEFQLEVLLEKVGLKKDIHYKLQQSFETEDGKKQQPDCIIFLPEKRNIIIDSKVTIKSLEEFFSANDTETQDKKAEDILNSITNHIDNLSSKKYHTLYDIKQPDFVLMFIPLESALSVALNKNPGLMDYALRKNVVIVTVSTLLATLRTIHYIWTQEDQKKYVQEIAKKTAELYDKFVGFTDDLLKIGDSLNKAQSSYSNAMNKLKEGKGNIISRIEKIKSFGLKTKKKLPEKILNETEDLES